jgi:hypothetical protein
LLTGRDDGDAYLILLIRLNGGARVVLGVRRNLAGR